MEKRILIAFIVSVVFVSFYNAVVLKPRVSGQPAQNSVLESEKGQEHSVSGVEGSSSWLVDLMKKESSVEVAMSGLREVKTDAGIVFFSDSGIYRVVQKVEGSSDVNLVMQPPVGIIDSQGSFFVSEVRKNSVHVGWKTGENNRVLHMIAAVLPNDMDLPPRYARYYQGISYVDNIGHVRRVSLAKAKKILPQLRNLRAVGLYSKYFMCCLWLDDVTISNVYLFQNNEKTVLAVDVVPVGETVSGWFYCGLGRSDYLKGFPKEKLFLKRSILSGISDVLWFILRWERKLIGSWGWTIVFFAVLFSLVFMPFTLKSYSAMQKLQKIQPKIQKLQEKYKDDPQKLNQELVMLYAANGVNPFSGCLPLLLQLPVFFALYPVLLTTYEFRDAGFFWIKSLAEPDVLLSIGPLEVHLLPLLVVALMLLQQLRSSSTQQNKGMVFGFVIVFLIIFYNMPSGLVLFWLVNSIMGWIQQVVIVPRLVKVE